MSLIPCSFIKHQKTTRVTRENKLQTCWLLIGVDDHCEASLSHSSPANPTKKLKLSQQ